MTIWSLYVPNGRELTHAHYAHKLEWLANLAEQGRGWLAEPGASLPRRRLERRTPGRRRVGHERFEGPRTCRPPNARPSQRSPRTDGSRSRGDRVTNYTYWDYQKLRFP